VDTTRDDARRAIADAPQELRLVGEPDRADVHAATRLTMSGIRGSVGLRAILALHGRLND
jgi:hypothetical protein